MGTRRGMGMGGMGGGMGMGMGGMNRLGPQEEAARNAAAVTESVPAQLRESFEKEVARLRIEAASEDRYTSLYQQERERINHFWLAEKKHLEELQSDLREKEQAARDLKERQDVEIKLCEQRVKHLYFHNLDNLIEERTNAELALKNSEDEHRVGQRELKYDVRSLKVQMKEKEVCQDEYLRSLKMEQDKRMTDLRHDFERSSHDLKDRYTEKMNRLRSDMENRKKDLITMIETKMNNEISDLTKLHAQKFVDIQNYYKNITDSNIQHIKQLQKEVTDFRAKESGDLKRLNKLQLEKKRCVNPLKETKQAVLEKKAELERFNEDKKKLNRLREQLEKIEEEINKWTWQYEVMFQKYSYVEKERDQLFTRFQDSVLELQQKTGLKNLILEKKIETISETLEAKDVQLHQILTAANLSPEAMAQVSQSLEDLEHAKDEAISEIQTELRKIREAHSNMVKTYEGKLTEFGIPVEELGFDPLVPANIQ